MLALAEALPQLRAFVHVSTAFVNGHQPQVPWVTGSVICFSVHGLPAMALLHLLDMRRDSEIECGVAQCMLSMLHDLQTLSHFITSLLVG